MNLLNFNRLSNIQIAPQNLAIILRSVTNQNIYTKLIKKYILGMKLQCIYNDATMSFIFSLTNRNSYFL